jgi:hypothetical protein
MVAVERISAACSECRKHKVCRSSPPAHHTDPVSSRARRPATLAPMRAVRQIRPRMSVSQTSPGSQAKESVRMDIRVTLITGTAMHQQMTMIAVNPTPTCKAHLSTGPKRPRLPRTTPSDSTMDPSLALLSWATRQRRVLDLILRCVG